jgi:hypothetical protein
MCYRMLLLISLSTLPTLMMPTVSRAEFYDFERWEKLTPSMRASYVAGVFDAYIYFLVGPLVAPEVSLATMYHSRCIIENNVSPAKLAENIRAFAASRPMLRGGYVQDALVQYLAHKCGEP